ncbi:MAG: hypothetical protein AB8H80_15535 [Planctomycetota bacterium]
MVPAQNGAEAIRTLATILISLLVAVALGTVLYALILAIGRDPLPGAQAAMAPPSIATLPIPETLPANQSPTTRADGSELRETDFRAPTPLTTEERVTLPIQVTRVPPDLIATAGVAAFHTMTGGEFRWHPLADAIPGQDDSLLVTADVAAGSDMTITFAANREQARHGYLSRLELSVKKLDGTRAPLVTLPGSVFAVTIELPTGADRAGPLRLQRVEDRQWLPMLHSSSGLTLRRGSDLELRLGAASYELQDPLAPERSQRFDVPETTSVKLSRDLVPARDGRL